MRKRTQSGALRDLRGMSRNVTQCHTAAAGSRGATPGARAAHTRFAETNPILSRLARAPC